MSLTNYNSVVETLLTFILSLFKIWLLVSWKLLKNFSVLVLGIHRKVSSTHLWRWHVDCCSTYSLSTTICMVEHFAIKLLNYIRSTTTSKFNLSMVVLTLVPLWLRNLTSWIYIECCNVSDILLTTNSNKFNTGNNI